MCSVLSTSPEKSTNRRHPVRRADTYFFFYFFFPLPFIIAACSALIIDFVAGADTRWSHIFHRWCRHSMLPFISSVVLTLDAPFYFVGGADTPPPSVHINPPPPCVHQVN